MALRYIENQWCLPNPNSAGIRHRIWLPIYVGDIQASDFDLPEFFLQEANISSSINLAAHAQLARIATTDNIAWIFGSEVLLLIDENKNRTASDRQSDWFDQVFDPENHAQKTIAVFRDIREVPYNYIKSVVEARIRPLDLTEALKLSPESHWQYIENLFLQINEPMNIYVRNIFLLRCICSIKNVQSIPPNCSLYELLALYVRSGSYLLSQWDSSELLDQQLPLYAYNIFSSIDSGLSKEMINLGVSCGLLSSKNSKGISSSPALDFFSLARLIQ